MLLPAMPVTRIGDVDIHTVSEGDGPLVVLLHGFPETSFSWRRQIPALAAAGFRAVAPDLRGYGESSKPAGIDSYRLTEVVKDIAGLIAQNGGVCNLVGHDWGGYAAWYLAMLHPELVSKLVVMNAPHGAALSRVLRRSMEQRLRLAYQLFFNLPILPELFWRLFGSMIMRRLGAFTSEEVAEYARSWRKPGATRAMMNYYRALRRHRRELRALVRPIRVPTLFIFGERDPVFVRETAGGFGEWVPDLRVERIPEAGHFVQTDAAEKVNALLIEFMKPTS